MTVLSQLRSFDVYPKTLEDFRDKWLVGAALSITSILVILILVVSEWNVYRSTTQQHKMFVDTEVTGKLPIHMNLTFPGVACSLLSIDAVDAFGESQLNVDQFVKKVRLGKNGLPLASTQDVHLEGVGDIHITKHIETIKDHLSLVQRDNYCGSCYGAEEKDGQCCNTCEDVRKAYEKKSWAFEVLDKFEQCAKERAQRLLNSKVDEGCNIEGEILVNRVQGVLHFAPGKTFMVGGTKVRDLLIEEIARFDVSHKIHRFSFGKEIPGLVNPLDGREHLMQASGLFQYHMKVVPTEFLTLDGRRMETNQYSVTEHFRRRSMFNEVVPMVMMEYDLSPIKVRIQETHHHRTFVHFLTSLCAVIGGVFTVAGIIDSLLYHGHQRFRHKGD